MKHCDATETTQSTNHNLQILGNMFVWYTPAAKITFSYFSVKMKWKKKQLHANRNIYQNNCNMIFFA